MIYPVPKPERQPKPLPKRIKARNAERGGHAFPKNVDTLYREWIRALPCILSGKMCAHGQHLCWGTVQVCHVKNRGAGGPDRQNCVPMCASAHDQQHVIGIPAFNKLWELDLAFLARRYTEQYEAEVFPCP